MMGRNDQQKRSEEVRRLIIETTVQIIKDEGFDSVSIRKIGDRMGYSTGVIYYHFKDKQEIIDTIHEQADNQIKEIIRSCFKEDTGCLEKIKSVFYGIMQIAVTQRDMFDLIVVNKYSDRNEKIGLWLDMIKNELDIGIAKKEIKPVDTYKSAFAIWSSFLGFNYMITKDDGIDMTKADEMFNVMSALIFDGLKAN
jgi:AcrR family transcriptional regulator